MEEIFKIIEKEKHTLNDVDFKRKISIAMETYQEKFPNYQSFGIAFERELKIISGKLG